MIKKTAILVIAAQNQAVYKHYIHTHWADLIEYTNGHCPHIDVYLLFQEAEDIGDYSYLRSNIIVDQNRDFNGYFASDKGHKAIPGILSKTIYAFEQLKTYDLFFRTNLSSLIHITNFERLIATKERFVYSGAAIWPNSLRKNLILTGKERSYKNLSMIEVLDGYKSDTFISGSAYFINRKEADYLIQHKNMLRYDLPDDVAVGLMIGDTFEYIPKMSVRMRSDESIDAILKKMEKQDYSHVRLERFSLEKAKNLWHLLQENGLWARTKKKHTERHS